MASTRFTKAVYVRRLEQLYADLSGWRDHYMSLAHHHWDRERAAAFEDRAIALEHAQHELGELIYFLDNIKRLS